MRKLRKTLAVLLVLGLAPGCGGTRGTAEVKAVLKDQAELIFLLKRLKNVNSVAQLAEPAEALKGRVEDNLKALGDLRDSLSDEDKLALQLKYGPSAENMYIILNRELKRIIRMAQQEQQRKVKGPPRDPAPVPFGGNDAILVSPQAEFLLEGYGAMSRIVLQDLAELSTTLGAIRASEQAADALPTLRKIRYRLSVDTVKLKHVEPLRPDVKQAQQDQLKAALTGAVGALNQEEERVRALPGGQEAVALVEPLPADLTALVGGP